MSITTGPKAIILNLLIFLRLNPGAGLQFQLSADRLSSSPSVGVTFLGEPIQVNLAPRTLHGALQSSCEALKAWRRKGSEVQMVPQAPETKRKEMVK